jgi:hypothetical protein
MKAFLPFFLLSLNFVDAGQNGTFTPALSKTDKI